MNTLSQYDQHYIERHAAEYDPELDDMDSLSAAWLIYLDECRGKVTHRSRCRIKAADYDWQRLNAWMTACRMTNESMVLIFELTYGKRLSVGTIANIGCGSYTYSDTVRRVMGIMERADGEA
jgi:hypothetical protein